MTIAVEVPSLGESITEAIIVGWEKKVGEFVQADEPLVELETDKVTVMVPAPAGGVLTEQLKGPGDRVQVGEKLASLDPTASKGGAAVAAPVAVQAPAHEEAGLAPAVRRLLEENRLQPEQIPASGPGGRLLKEDVLAYLETKQAPQAPKAAPAAPKAALPQVTNGAEAEERVPMSPLRQRVAQRLVEAQQTAAILTTFNEVDMSAAMDLRKRYQDQFVAKYGIKLGYMSFFVKATIEALKAYPAVNAEIRGTDIIYKNYYHVGVAVGGGKGLVVPVLRNADRLSFAETELAIAELAKRAKENRISLEELSGGTFTISNGGVYGSMLSTPILNPPQTGILGMHKIMDRPVGVSGQVVLRPMMYLALSYDHRLIDGREAVGFLVRIKECIEDPERILLEI